MVERLLRAQIRLIDVAMLGAGSAIGASVFSVLGPAARIAGSGILLTLALAAFPMCVFGVIYAFMASSAPRTAASFEWPREYIHPFAGFSVAWLRILGQVGQLATLGTVLAKYLDATLHLPARLVMLAAFTTLWRLNLRGIQIAARTQTLLMTVFIVVLGIFCATGIPYIDVRRILPMMSGGWRPILLAAPIMINLFMGIEAATELGEEVRDPTRNIPLGIAISIVLISVIYVSVCFVALGVIGPEHLAVADAPLVSAAKPALGTYAAPLIVTAAVLSLFKSMNATYLLFARSLFALGRSGLLLSLLGRVDPKRGSPYIALHVAFGCACAGTLFSQDLIFLLVASSIPTVVKYLSTSVCALRIARGKTGKLADAGLHVPAAVLVGVAWLGIACALAILALAFADEWRASILIAGWALCGLVYWFAYGMRRMRSIEWLA